MHLMKKVLLYTDTPLFGGAENHIYQLVKYLDKTKYEVVLLCSKYKSLDDWAKKIEQTGIKVVRIPTIHKHDPQQFFRLKKILSQENADILHLHLWNPGSCRFAYLAASKKQKIVATEHDPFLLQGIKQALKKNFLQRTDHLIAVSNANREMIIKNYPEVESKITVIHNGIEIEEFTDAANKISKDPTSFIIIAVATLHERKGLKYLIEATKIVSRNHENIQTLIVGTGPEKEELQQLIKTLDLESKVKLLGYQDNVARLMAASNLLVLPSIKEAFGLVLLEAMAAKIPVIATNVDGIPEIIEDNVSGLLFEKANSKNLADKIEMIIKDQELAKKLVESASEKVKEFTAKNMAQKTELIYDSLS